MCDPITLAASTFALSALGSVTSFAAQSANAKQQERAYQANAESARQAAIRSYEDVIARRNEERRAASERMFDARQEALRRRSRTRVAAGEAGVTGLSVRSLLADQFGQEGRTSNRLNNTALSTDIVLNSQLEQIESRTNNQINSVSRGLAPSPLSLIAGIGASALDGYNTYRRAKGP